MTVTRNPPFSRVTASATGTNSSVPCGLASSVTVNPGRPPSPWTSSTPVTLVESPGATADFTVRMDSVVAVGSVAWAGATVSAGTAPAPTTVAASATPVAARRSSVVVMQDLLVGARPRRARVNLFSG